MQSGGMKLMISYFVIYVGIVSLITCAAILALQQLSEASDNTERYRLLRRLGTSGRMIDRALFTQILSYFMLPLGLAVIHSVVGISVVNNAIAQFGHLNALPNILMAALLFLIIYGGYFLATFLGSRKMIRSKEP